jgi:hypothetical protein
MHLPVMYPKKNYETKSHRARAGTLTFAATLLASSAEMPGSSVTPPILATSSISLLFFHEYHLNVHLDSFSNSFRLPAAWVAPAQQK